MLSAYPMYYNLSVVCTGSRWNRFGDSWYRDGLAYSPGGTLPF